MMIDTTYSLYALIIANASLVAAAALAVLRFQRVLRESAAFWESPTGAAIQTDTREQTDYGKLLLQEIAVLQKTVAKLRIRQQPRDEPAPSHVPIEHALRMAKRGASIEDLRKSCGLNIGEAKLMHRLHGKQAGRTSVPATN